MAPLEVREIHPAFGAEIRGYDPEALDDAETRRRLQDLFDTRELLLFRDLDLTHADQVRLSKVLFRKEDAEETGAPPREDTFYVSNRRPASAAPFGRLQFHADAMWSDRPYEVLSLYGLEVEQPAAPTSFVSGVHAWKTLPADLRARVEGLEVLHSAGSIRRRDVTDVLVSNVERPPSTVTRLGHRHPRTGETILYASEQMTQEVVGMSPEDSERLLEEVFEHLYSPEACLDHEWREGDLVIWDNLALQHARKNVLTEGPARTLRKVAEPMTMLRPDQRPSYAAAR